MNRFHGKTDLELAALLRSTNVEAHMDLRQAVATRLEILTPKPERTYESPEIEASSKAMASLLKASACMYNIDRGDLGRRIGNLVDELQAEFEQVDA